MQRKAPQQKQFPKAHIVERGRVVLRSFVVLEQTTALVDVDLQLVGRYVYQHLQRQLCVKVGSDDEHHIVYYEERIQEDKEVLLLSCYNFSHDPPFNDQQKAVHRQGIHRANSRVSQDEPFRWDHRRLRAAVFDSVKQIRKRLRDENKYLEDPDDARRSTSPLQKANLVRGYVEWKIKI